MENAEIAAIFEEIADILEIQGDNRSVSARTELQHKPLHNGGAARTDGGQ